VLLPIPTGTTHNEDIAFLCMQDSGATGGKPDPVLIQHCDESDGFAGVYPEHKHMIVTALQAKGRLVGMTGEC